MLVVQDAPITVGNEAVAEKIGSLKFASATYRLFKLPNVLDDEQEDYGQRVVYKGMYGARKHADVWVAHVGHTSQHMF
jgi:hypothetical protein